MLLISVPCNVSLSLKPEVCLVRETVLIDISKLTFSKYLSQRNSVHLHRGKGRDPLGVLSRQAVFLSTKC